VPMLILIGTLSGKPPGVITLILQATGGVLIALILAWILIKDRVSLPFSRLLVGDREMQVFAALVICFGLALLTGLLGLSTALGAFVAGMLITAARETRPIHRSLEPFRVVFVALFFVSIGMLVDLRFLQEYWWQTLFLVLAVFLTNTLINGIILRLLGDSWFEGLYAGAMLAQIGEFSFVLAAVGKQAQIITEFAYQETLAVIAITLLLSPVWIGLIKVLLTTNDAVRTGWGSGSKSGQER
jgi:CPA2 family monovalent cation:H+ antiporter-2